MSRIEVEELIGKGYSCNVFLVRSSRNFLIDAGIDSVQRIIEAAEETSIDRIILTHRHVDHVADAEDLSEKLDAPIYAPLEEAEALRSGDDRTVLGSTFGRKLPPMEVNDLTESEYSGFQILKTPGHTEGSISLYHPDNKILFSGDTVFSHGSVGRTDLPTGDREELLGSVKTLSDLDVDSLYPGHMSPVSKGADKHILLAKKHLKYM